MVFEIRVGCDERRPNEGVGVNAGSDGDGVHLGGQLRGGQARDEGGECGPSGAHARAEHAAEEAEGLGGGGGGDEGVVRDGVAAGHFVEQVESALDFIVGGVDRKEEVVGSGVSEVGRGGVEGGDGVEEAVVSEVAGQSCVEVGSGMKHEAAWRQHELSGVLLANFPALQH